MYNASTKLLQMAMSIAAIFVCGGHCLAQEESPDAKSSEVFSSLVEDKTSIQTPTSTIDGSTLDNPVDDKPMVEEPKSIINLEGAILKTIDSTIITAQVTGILEDVQVKEGVLVQAGELLGKVKDDAVRLKLAQQQTQLVIAQRKQSNQIDKKVAEKSRDVAETEYQRALNANARVSNTYPLNEIDRLRLVAERSRLEVERAVYDLEMAALDVSVANSELKQTEELLDRHKIVSPVDGMIVNVDKRPGEWVEPGKMSSK